MKPETDKWFSLPLKIRQRWWRETDYGKNEPSPELSSIISNLLEKKVTNESNN